MRRHDAEGATCAGVKAMREAVGLSQSDLADLVGVTVRTVKRWERDATPPADVCDLLERYVIGKAKAVEAALETVDRVTEQMGHAPDLVPMTYYRSQAEYDELGRDPGPVGVANANARAVADALMARGVAVEFRYPDEGAVRTPGSGY